MLLILVDQIKQCERDIFRMLSNDFGCDSTDVLRGSTFGQTGTEIPEQRDATFSYNLLSNFVHGGEYAPNAAWDGFVRHWAVGNSKVCLFDKAVAIDFKSDVVVPSRRTAIERRIDQRLKDVPDFFPTLADRLTQCPWMFRPKHWNIGIVVDRYILRSPPQEQWKAVGKQETRHHSECGGPVFYRPQCRFGPVERANPFAHFAAAGEERRIGWRPFGSFL